jgi:hypothetical protein
VEVTSFSTRNKKMAAGKEVDFSDASVQAAYNKVKDMKASENYLSLGLVGKSNKAEVVGTGTGGLNELAATFAEDRVCFALLRVIAADVQENVTSNREKYVYISWIGPKVGVMQRAKVGMQSKVVQNFFTGISLAVVVDASTAGDITMEAIAKRLLACGGAHKPTKYVFGPGQEYSLLDLLGAAGPRHTHRSAEESKATSPTATASAETATTTSTE